MTLACIRDTRNAKVYQELAQPTTVDFDLVPLIDSLDYLADLHGIPIALDRAAFEAANINPDLPLTGKLAKVRLQFALQQMLWPEKLGWKVADGRLIVTTRAEDVKHVREMDERRKRSRTADPKDAAAGGGTVGGLNGTRRRCLESHHAR